MAGRCRFLVLLLFMHVLSGSAQTDVPCFTGLGCGTGDVGLQVSVRDCCSIADTLSFRTTVGGESCFTCYGFGWVQNISSDLTSAEPQTEITAVEGETVTLTLFYTKNNPPNSLRLDFNIQTSGSATDGEDYVVTPDPASVFMDEVSLRLVPVIVNVTLFTDGIGGEGTEDIFITLVQLPPIEPERVLVNPTVRIVVEDNDIQTGFRTPGGGCIPEGVLQEICLTTVGSPAVDTVLTVSVTYGTAGPEDFDLLTTQVTITGTMTEPCVSFQAVADDLGLEEVENLTLSLSGPPNVQLTTASLQICIQDSDVVTFEFFVEEAEADEDELEIDVTITRSVATAEEVSFTLTPTEYDASFGFPIATFDPRSPNLATPGTDYVPDVIQFTIPPGDGPTVIPVLIIDDVIAEDSDQYFIGVLGFSGSPTGAVLGRDAILMGIQDNDQATIGFQFLLSAVDEQDVDFTHNLLVTRDVDSEQNYSISLSGSPNTAEDDDFFVSDDTFYFPPDVSSINVSVTIRGDTRIELAETFNVRLRQRGGPNFVVDPLTRLISVGIRDNDGGDVIGRGEVVWEMGMVGVTEGSGSVEVCANYTQAVEGFTVETSTTEVFAINGSDFLAQIGPTAHLVWNAGSTIACVSIPIIDDERVENDEIFYVNMVRIVSSPSGDDPRLAPQAIIMIMDDDLIPIVFTVDSIVTTDDQATVEACLEVDNELVDENVAYRIPIAVETQDGTAQSDVDFVPLNNVTGGEASRGLLTPPRPSRCFTISLLTRQDNQLDDRNFFLAVMLIDGARINPLPEQIQLPADLEINIQPAAQIEVGDITDSVLSNPLFSVTLDMKADEDDSYLCYEVHGDSGLVLNLVSDTCFSINAAYETIEGAPSYNKIDELFITTSDAAGGCSNIEIPSSESCMVAYLLGSDYGKELRERYRRNGVQVEFLDGRIEVTLPCQRYPGGGIKVVVKCNAEYQNPVTEEMLPVKNLDLTFHRGKLASDAYPMPHGLLGQFWRLDFAQEPFRQQFVDGNPRENAFVMTTPVDLGVRSFVGIMYHLTWDLREKQCLYAGSRQAGTSRYVTSPADSVIEGVYQYYSVSGRFGTDYQYSVFPRNDFNCPTPGI